MQRHATTGFVKAVDLALFCILCVAPFFLGGRYAVGRFVYVALAVSAAVAWTLGACFDDRARWRRTAGLWIIVLGLGLVVVQMTPLPGWLLAKASPVLAERFPLWSAGGEEAGQLGMWSRISLIPQETLAGAAIFLAYGMLFLVACQRMNTLRDVERILGWIALAAVVLAAVGLVQYASGTGKYLGFYEHPFRSPSPSTTAAFYNGNHFAHMLALGIGPLVWWLASSLQSQQQQRPGRFSGRSPNRMTGANTSIVVMIGIGIVLFAGLMSASRGGMLVIAMACVIVGGLLWRRDLLPRRAAAALGISAAIVAVAMTVHGLEQVTPHISDLTSGSVEQLDSSGFRRAVWSANVEAIPDFWMFGAGVGTHRYVLPTYLKENPDIEFTHAESGYLQVALETGIGGVILCAAAVGLCLFWCWKGWRRAPDGRHAAAVAAVTAGIAASLAHSIWDFVWYIPATMATTAILIACACRLAQLTTTTVSETLAESCGSRRDTPTLAIPGERRLVPVMAYSLMAVTAVASLWMLNNRIGPALASPAWDNYLRTAVAVRETDRRIASKPSEAEQSALVEERVAKVDAMIAYLKEVVRRDAKNGRAHLRLAGQCLVRFELASNESPNHMPLSQIRDAATRSHFASRQALDQWLSSAFGPTRKYLDLALAHTRRGIALCPVEAQGYLYLSDLCFLEGRGQLAGIYLDQAQRVRPNDGDVLLRAGTEAWLAKDTNRAIELWRRAYRSGCSYQLKLVRMLGGQVPVEFFLQVFEPNLDVLRRMETYYRRSGFERDLVTLRQVLAMQTESAARDALPEEAATLWFQAHRLHDRLNVHEDALRCGREAVKSDPYNLPMRLTFGRYLLKQKIYAEAERHLKWCVTRKPTDNSLQQALRTAARGKLLIQ